MNWYKIAAKIGLEHIHNAIFQSVSLVCGGNWNILEQRNLANTFTIQKYGVITILGKDVYTNGDEYFLKVFYLVWKTNDPKGRRGPSWDEMDKYKKNEDYLPEHERVNELDSAEGHPLLELKGFLEGWKPGMMPESELDRETALEIKDRDFFDVSSPGEPRHKMAKVFSFEKIKSPFELAQLVKSEIERFNNPGFDNDEDDESPVPPPITPRQKSLITI